MSRIPDFSKIKLDTGLSADLADWERAALDMQSRGKAQPFGKHPKASTLSHSTPRATGATCLISTAIRACALHARALRDHVCQQTVDGTPICRLFDRRGLKCVLPAQSEGRAKRLIGRL